MTEQISGKFEVQEQIYLARNEPFPAPEQARQISSRMLGVSVLLAPHLVPFADVPGDSLRQAGTPRSHGLFWLLRPLGECNESLGHCLQVKKQS